MFGNVDNKVKEAEDNLLEWELEYDQLRSDAVGLQLSEARAIHTRWKALQSEFWRQKVAMKWIKSRNANMPLFHASIKQRQNDNFLSHIEGENGQ